MGRRKNVRVTTTQKGQIDDNITKGPNLVLYLRKNKTQSSMLGGGFYKCGSMHLRRLNTK